MSIKKVANIAGVSIATVSRYFNNPDKVSKKTQEKVQSAADKIDYSPNSLAQNLRRGRTGLIIAVVPSLSSPIFEPIIRQLNKIANDKDYTLLIKEAEYNSLTVDYFKYRLRCKQADGFIVLSGLNTLSDKATIQNSGLPIVLAFESDSSRATGLPYLSIDYASAAKEATQFLIDQQHRHIAFLAKNYDANNIKVLEENFKSTIEAIGHTVSAYSLTEGEHTLSIKEKLDRLLDNTPRPSAILCTEDETAMEAMHWLKQKGFTIPDDISVMGFHNTKLSALCDPPLTTVNNPLENIGYRAIETLFKLINGETIEKSFAPFEHNIVIRKSIKRLKKTEKN